MLACIAQQRSDGTIAAPARPSRELFRGAALQRRGSADLIAAEVRERILAGDLVSGDPLREAELAEAFGVARNTVREALRLLTQGGLATYEMHHGVTVRRHTPAEVAAIFDVREIIESAAGAAGRQRSTRRRWRRCGCDRGDSSARPRSATSRAC